MKGWGRARWRRRPGALAFVLALALAGCANGLTASGDLVSGTVIDRYKIGDPLDCGVNGDPTCDEMLRIATDVATSKRGIASSAIVEHRLYTEFIPPGSTSGGGMVGIVVFDLGDGSRAAVGVYCGVGGCQVVNR